jgi:hypothetical protein
MGIDGNETADQLATQGSSHLLIGSQPTLCIFAKAARGVIRNWTGRKQEGHWKYRDRLRAFLKKILCRKSWDLSNLSRNQLRILKGLATGHCYLKQHLFKLFLVHSPCMVDVCWHLKWLHRFFVIVRLWQTESLLCETR